MLFTLPARVKKDYSSWDYVYVVVFRGLWPSHLPLGFIVFGRATPIPFKRRIIRSLRPLQSRLIEWNPGGRSSLRIQVSYTNDRPRLTVFLPRLHAWRNGFFAVFVIVNFSRKTTDYGFHIFLSFMWAKIKKTARDIPLKYIVELNGSILSYSRSTHDLIVKVEKGIKIYFCRLYFLPLSTIALWLLSYSFFMSLTHHFFLHRNKSRQTRIVRGA